MRTKGGYHEGLEKLFFDNARCSTKGIGYTGRKYYAGFYCLFYHLEYLYSLDNKLLIDFWGRRNKTYDELKNDYIIRKHIVVYKKE